MNALYHTAVISLALLVGCSKSDPDSGTSTTPTPTATPAHASATGDTFKKRCAPCHGDTGRGDGPMAVKLPTKPPSFADIAWQQSLTDDAIRKVIVDGGAAVGKSPAMPAAHDLDGKPELDEIVSLVRSFRAE